MSDFHDHNVVETPTGTFPVLPDTDQTIPIHWVDTLDVLVSDGRWTPKALEAVIGKPSEYASRIVRLFVVLPELTALDVNIPGMANMLNAYAMAENLSIKVTYFPNADGSSEKRWFNKGADKIWVSIDIVTSEVVNAIVADYLDPGVALINDMHIAPGFGYWDNRPGRTEIDIDRMAPDCALMFPRNTRYDYNTIVVHRVADGERTRTEYPIGMTGFRTL